MRLPFRRPLGLRHIFDYLLGSRFRPPIPPQACTRMELLVLEDRWMPDASPIIKIRAIDPYASEVEQSSGAFQLTRTGDLSESLQVFYSIGGNATSGTDYVALSGDVTFDADSAYATIVVTPLVDADSEMEERVIVTLANGTGYQVDPAANSSVVALLDPPEVTVKATDDVANEGSANSGFFTLTRNWSASSTTVNYRVTGTAIPGVDYTELAGNVTFGPGETSKTVLINPINDSLVKANRTVELHLLPTGDGWFQLGSNETATVEIREDDSYSVSVAATEIVRSTPQAETGRFTLTRNGTYGNLTVNVSLSGDAELETDYTLSLPFDANTVVIPDGQSSAIVNVTRSLDDTVGSGLMANLAIANGTGYTPSVSNTAFVQIDRLPLVRIGTYANGSSSPGAFTTESGAGNLTLRVARYNASSGNVVVQLANGVAGLIHNHPTMRDFYHPLALSGIDFEALPTEVVIPDGEEYVDIPVVAIDDSDSETPVEVSRLTILSSTTSDFYDDGNNNVMSAWFSVLDDDGNPFHPSEVDIRFGGLSGAYNDRHTSVDEGGVLEIVFYRESYFSNTTVSYSIGGSATTGVDYGNANLTGSVVLVPDWEGMAETTLTIPILTDSLREGEESFYFEIDLPEASEFFHPISNSTIHVERYIASLVDLNENQTPTIASIANATVGPGTLVTRVANATDADLPAQTLTYSLVDAPLGATMASNGTFQWTPEEWQAGLTYPITVRVIDSDFDLPAFDETTFYVTVRPTVSVRTVDSTATEGISNGTFQFARSGDLSEPLVVSYQLAGSASAGDFWGGGASSSITIESGQRYAFLRIDPHDDAMPDDGETVVLSLLSGDYEFDSGSYVSLTIYDRAPLPAATCPDGMCGTITTILDQAVNEDVLSTNPNSTASTRYSDGVVRVFGVDLASGGVGGGLRLTRNWSNGAGYSFAQQDTGSGWSFSQTPRLVPGDREGTLVVTGDGQSAWYFDQTGGGYEQRLGGSEVLSYEAATDTYRLTLGTGSQIVFSGFSNHFPSARRGQFESLVRASGVTTAVTAWTAEGRIVEMRTTNGSLVESLLFDRIGSGMNLGLVETATLRRSDDGGASWEEIERVEYSYYEEEATHGNAGDLQTATTYVGVTATGTSYYRYYTGSEENGYQHGLKFAFEPAAFARLSASYDPFTASDAEASVFADYHYEYDAQSRVITAVISGAGCSSCAGGQGEFTYEYVSSENLEGPNHWATKTVEHLPDGSTTNTVYTNRFGQVMLFTTHDAMTNQDWMSYNWFNEKGRRLLSVSPSGVSGYDDTYADLVHWNSGTAQYLRDDLGVFTAYSLYSPGGGPESYLNGIAIRQGELGVDIPQWSATYSSNTLANGTFYHLASETLFRHANGTGNQTTSYSYAFYTGTNAIQAITTTLPVVTTGQNGSGTASVSTEVFDRDGRPLWSKDAAGVLAYWEYDPATGGVLKSILDVDTDLTTTFANLPSGWSSPSGFHQTTAFEVDFRGRTTKETGPDGMVTYTVYNDSEHETRVYSAWNANTLRPTLPTQVYRENWSAGYTETLSMTATPTVSGGRPTGGESYGNLTSLSRSYVNDAGQIVRIDEYFSFDSVVYLQSPMGNASVQYQSTALAYDTQGRLSKTVSPSGTIYRTIFDSLGRVASEWIGTDDTPTTGFWSPTNLAGTNTTKVADYEYDGGGVGDSLLTVMTHFSGNTTLASNQVTQYAYDWRNRIVAIKQGAESAEATDVNRPLTVYSYDNLNQLTRTRVYDGDSIILTDANGDGIADGTSLDGLTFRLGSTGDDGLSAIATDAAGNVYVTGHFSSTVDFDLGTGTTYLNAAYGSGFVAKYSAGGDLVWVTQADAAPGKLAVSASGEAFAIGRFSGNDAFGGTYLESIDSDVFVWKLNANGTTAWVNNAGGSGTFIYETGIAVDASGVYASGTYYSAGVSFGGNYVSLDGSANGYVWKLDSGNGSTQWVFQGGGGSVGLSIDGVTTDGSSAVYVIGGFSGDDYSVASTTFHYTDGDGLVWKLDAASGEAIWASQAGSPGEQPFYSRGITTNGTGVYAGAWVAAGNAAFGSLTYEFTNDTGVIWRLEGSDGSTSWVARSGADTAGVVADNANGVYSAGTFSGNVLFGNISLNATGSSDAYVWRVNASSGDTEWATHAGGNSSVTTYGAAAGSAGAIYVAGAFSGNATFGNITLPSAGSGDGFVWRATALLRAESLTSFDDLGRVYKTESFRVDPVTGVLSSASLKSETWYDERSLVRKQMAPNSPVMKYGYDSLGRLTIAYVTNGQGDANYTHALSVSDDIVLEQTEYAHDAADRLIQVTNRQRFHDATGNGPLGNTSGNQPRARVYNVGYYYDLAGRTTDVVNVGTNGNAAWTNPTSVPSRSDTILVTSSLFGDDGYVQDMTDARGIVTRTLRDALGRTLATIEDFGGANKTVLYTYGPAGMTSLTAVNADTGNQTTQWVYGVTTASGSGLNSNDIVGETRHPDPATGAANATLKDVVTVSALGQTLSATDRNGTTHEYGYNAIGRLTVDRAVVLGNGIDGGVRRQEFRQDTLGGLVLATQYDATVGGNVVSQVARQFNGFGQLTVEYQAVAGAVNGNTPSVQYGYSEAVGGVNHSRLMNMTYPDGRVLTYDYGSANSTDDRISRLACITDSTGTLESYEYLGLATVVIRSHPQADVSLSHLIYAPLAHGEAGDQYGGLDRFGRVVDQRWVQGNGTEIDRFQYGYDRNSNRLWRDNLMNASFGELYGYDNLNQLTSMQRGELDGNRTGIVGNASRTQDWAYDPLGNWNGVTTDGVEETRTHDAQNRVTGVGNTTLTFDSAGNMLTDEQGQQYKYDAWNRLKTVWDSGNTIIASYGYDALRRRVAETHGNDTKDLLYSSQWQVLEERNAASGNTTLQYAWSPVYVDAMIERKRDTDGNGSLDERLWVQQDANWNVTSLVDSTASVVERYAYDAYGVRTVLSSTWATKSGSDYSWRQGFQGMFVSDTTGLWGSRGRDGYSATLGRWIQSDPIGFAAGLNMYQYVSANPQNHTDPSGYAENYWIRPGESGWDQTVSDVAKKHQVNGRTVSRVGAMHWRGSHDGLPDHFKVFVEFEGGGSGEIGIKRNGDVISSEMWESFFDRDPKANRANKLARDKQMKNRKKGSVSCDGLAALGIASVVTGGVFYVVESSYSDYMEVGESGGFKKANEISFGRTMQLAFASGELVKGEQYVFYWRGDRYSVWTQVLPRYKGTGETHFLFAQKVNPGEAPEWIIGDISDKYPIVSTR